MCGHRMRWISASSTSTIASSDERSRAYRSADEYADSAGSERPGE